MLVDTTCVGPKAQAMIQRDERLLSPSYTREYALVVDRAQGSEIWDVDGRRYIDFMAGIAVHNVGHRHPHVVAAVEESLSKFWHICLSDFYYPQAVELAEKLETIAPMSDPTRYFFGNTGTEAIEAAAKLAMYHTGRRKFIGFMGAFHGRSLGALSFTASKAVQRAKYPTGIDVLHVPYPDAYRHLLMYNPDEKTYGDAIIDYIEDEIFRVKLDPHDVAGVLVEAIQGEGGYIVPAPNFFPRLRELCDRHGIMLIVDEVQSGVGRTGRWWGIENENVEPDIVAFAKGIASGFPLGGIIARESVMTWKSGAHGSTFGGNPLALAAGLATIEVIEQENLLYRSLEAGCKIMTQLDEMMDNHPSIGDVRGRGLMIGIEFVKDRVSRKRAKALRNTIIQHAFENGLLLLPCGESAVRMVPPLNISDDLIDEGMHIFEQSVTAAEEAHHFS